MFQTPQKYMEEILHRVNMSNSKAIATSIDTNSKFIATDGSLFTDPTLYRGLARPLQYVTFTRLDIAYVIQQICLFMHAPRDSHFNAIKRVLRYFKGTLDLRLHIYPFQSSQLIYYTDADWGGCPDTRRSTTGYCVFLGDNLISWFAKRQPTLSRSSVEDEYQGLANVVAETCWLRNLLLELYTPLKQATLVSLTMFPLSIFWVIQSIINRQNIFKWTFILFGKQ